jgi:hypothetical protein
MKEVWKELSCNDNYYVSNFGRIKNGDKIMSGHKSCYGYIVVSIKGKRHFIHRLVAKEFIENTKNKSEVNHINGIKDDNRLENLEWVTRNENQKHAYNNGLMSRKGEKHNNAKFKEKDIIFIRKSKLKQIELAKMFNVSRGHMSLIINRKLWNYDKLCMP